MTAIAAARPDASPAVDALSVVVAARDEASSIDDVLHELLAVLDELRREQGLTWEVIIVDDGSSDATGEIVGRWAERGVRLLTHRRGRGYGAALKTGIDAAAHDWILIIDADGTYPPCHVAEILARCGGERMVVGARTGEAADVPLVRRPAKWVLRRLASTLSGVEIPDLNSGLRAFPRALARRFAHLLPDGFSFTSTITLAALARGWRVEYVPIDYRRRSGRSKIRPIRDTLGFLVLIVRTVMFFDPLRVLLPLGILFVLASGAVGFGSLALTGTMMDVTTVVLFVTGVQVVVLGLIADAINRHFPP